jgi:hypothetical protein
MLVALRMLIANSDSCLGDYELSFKEDVILLEVFTYFPMSILRVDPYRAILEFW